MVAKALFSSATDEWSTPQDLFDELNAEFNFTLDVCATPENAKCERYFTKDYSCLSHAWGNGARSNGLRQAAFLNPPYGNPEYVCKPKCKKKKCAKRGRHCTEYVPGIVDFMSRAAHEASENGWTVVCLVPARTDSRWWHTFVEPIRQGKALGELRFVKGRLKFGGSKNSAPFPSAVVVMRPR